MSYAILMLSRNEGIRLYPTHKECANFRNGICMLYRIPVNPDAPACPRFTAKSVTAQPPHVDLEDLRRRVDRLEAKLREIKSLLKTI